MKATLERESTEPLKERFVAYVKQYAAVANSMPPPEPAAGTSGALKGALNRAVRYGDKKTHIASPKPANSSK